MSLVACLHATAGSGPVLPWSPKKLCFARFVTNTLWQLTEKFGFRDVSRFPGGGFCVFAPPHGRSDPVDASVLEWQQGTTVVPER